jgi:hypothetical protein
MGADTNWVWFYKINVSQKLKLTHCGALAHMAT